jgi:leucyl-tRNA synthetase
MNFKEYEKKWQEKWQKDQIYKVDLENVSEEEKFYTLVMFSYPSGDKLHIGHWYNYGPTDTYARFKFMNGKKVFQPMGFDAFGLPAENYAIKTGIHPETSTKKNINTMTGQLTRIGAMYDWENDVVTCDINYYKWTQWLFLKLYDHKLAYRAEAPVNWCPHDKTVLANEQVSDGECERCGTQVIRKNLTQWFFKITAYAEELLSDLDKIDWPESTKAKQREWIGRSEGAEIQFKIKGHDKHFKVFTTRPDTLYGATFATFAPEHDFVKKMTTPEQKEAVEKYLEYTKTRSEVERLKAEEKTGVFTGAYAINPINGEEIPIWISDYVLMTYGTGAVMAVPGHDERDFEFAKKFDLPIKKVILEKGKEPETALLEAYTAEGVLVHSGKHDGYSNQKAKKMIVDDLADLAEFKINYKLRDWLISRQRYWGAPIPIVYDKNGNEKAIDYHDLPVVLPTDIEFSTDGESPLKNSTSFKELEIEGKKYYRETDTMDTFVCSAWYFLRYMNGGNTEEPFNKELTNKWMPVDKYVGGADHATMHLLYARFIHKALRDMGYLNSDEPFRSLTHQGMILGPDGNKMSKSKGNVVSPDEYVEKYGADVFRCALMFGFSYEMGGPWEESSIESINRFFGRVWRMAEANKKYANDLTDFEKSELGKDEKSLLNVLHNSIKGITEDVDKFQFNTSISRLMEAINEYYRYIAEKEELDLNTNVLGSFLTTFTKLIAPFAPHMADELWEKFGFEGFATTAEWPKYNEKFLTLDEVTYVFQVNGKIRAKVDIDVSLSKEEIEKIALESERIKEFTVGKTIRKVIVVPKKLVNIVAN